MEKLKSWLAVIALLVSIFQMLFSNSQLAREHFETTTKIVELTKEVAAQNMAIEAALYENYEPEQ